MRITKMDQVICNVSRLKGLENIHMHLDLIAGLPYEDYRTFENSFNQVYSMRPDQLQLGFLKMLKGTKLRQEAAKHDYRFRDYPPYEVLYNKYLSFDEILELKGIEEIVERYFNSGRFQSALEYVIPKLFASPFAFFRKLYLYFREQGYLERSLPSREYYNVLIKSLKEKVEGNDQLLLINEILKFDYLASDNTNNLPSGIKRTIPAGFMDKCFEFLKNEHNIKNFLPQFEGMPAKQIVKQVHFEPFNNIFQYKNIEESFKSTSIVVIFDYTQKDKVTNRYKHQNIPISL
jgi:hypothetical protein